MATSVTLRIVLAAIVFLVVAFVPKGIVWVAFVSAAGLFILCGYSLVRRAARRSAPIYLGTNPPPWWFDATLSVVAVVIIASAVPGLFFGQPNWAIDHVYRAISVVLGNAT